MEFPSQLPPPLLSRRLEHGTAELPYEQALHQMQTTYIRGWLPCSCRRDVSILFRILRCPE